jgi:lysophospholipase L1-like esterase/mannose-6-phosphate isomerase-like protein (cupin superfamily)
MPSHCPKALRRIRWLLALLSTIFVANAVAAATRVMIVGDSTASSYPQSRYPRTGWGQVLDRFLVAELPVLNRAVSGRSTRSYVDEGYFASAMAELGAGDLLLIQFGHNDAKIEDPERYADSRVDYPAGLRRFIEAARSHGATPVLITPVARRVFDAALHAEDSHGDYDDAVRRLAQAEGVALIDLNRRSMDWLEALGAEASKAYYLHDPAIGLADDTHFHRRGAMAIACMVAGDLLSLGLITAEQTTRDTDCGVPANQRLRLANQAQPSLIEQADIIAQEQPGPHGGDGLSLGSSFFADAPGLAMAVRRRVLHQGASIGLHGHGKDEVYYIISGRAELTVDGRAHVVGPGTAILTRDGSSHSLRQLGTEDLSLLIVYGRSPP